MIKLHFHKLLQKYTNVEYHSFEVIDFESLFSGLKFTFPKLIINEKEFFALVYGKEKNIVPKHWYLKKRIPVEIDEFWIIPLVQGSGGRLGTLAIGAALIALSFAFPPAAAGASALSSAGLAAAAGNIVLGIGINLVLSSLFLQELKKPDDKGEDADRVGNDSFEALQNTIDQSISVPLNYGDIRVAGQLISGTINTINHGRDEIITVGNFFVDSPSSSSIPTGADGIVDFINDFYDLGIGSLTLDSIITETGAVTSNGLDLNLLTNSAHMIGDLLAKMSSLDYTIVIEWEETATTTGQDLLFTLGSTSGAFPTDYVIMQNLGGAQPNQMYFQEALASELNNRDAISDFSGDQNTIIGINKMAIAINSADIKAAINGFGFLNVAFGAGARIGTATITVGAFGDWEGSTVGPEAQRIRKITFYPTTFDETTLEGYTVL